MNFSPQVLRIKISLNDPDPTVNLLYFLLQHVNAKNKHVITVPSTVIELKNFLPFNNSSHTAPQAYRDAETQCAFNKTRDVGVQCSLTSSQQCKGALRVSVYQIDRVLRPSAQRGLYGNLFWPCGIHWQSPIHYYQSQSTLLNYCDQVTALAGVTSLDLQFITDFSTDDNCVDLMNTHYYVVT